MPKPFTSGTEIVRAVGRPTWMALVAGALVLGALLLVRVATWPAPRETTFSTDRQLEDYRQLLSRDVIPPVYDPTFLPAADAPLSPDELVIGVEIGGQARAYPVGFLNFREMVNDRIGPVPFLVTW